MWVGQGILKTVAKLQHTIINQYKGKVLSSFYLSQSGHAYRLSL